MRIVKRKSNYINNNSGRYFGKTYFLFNAEVMQLILKNYARKSKAISGYKE